MRKVLLIIGVGVLVWIGLTTSFVTVDPTDYVYITQFGEPVATYDGTNDDDAGLHTRLPWPVQSAQRLDRRLQVFDLPGIETLTSDPDKNTIDKTLTIDAYVCWRIDGKEAVDRFIRKLGTLDRARTILGQRISSQLAAEVVKVPMEDLVSIQPGRVEQKMENLRQQLLYQQKDSARQEYGVAIEDIRIRRLNYPPQVRNSIFERIRTERSTRAADYRREGTVKAAEIDSEAKKGKRIIIANARETADGLRGDAIAEADRIRNAAQGEEKEFYKFLKKVDDFARILGESKTVLYLTTRNMTEMFEALLKQKGSPPGVKAQASPKKAGPKGQ
jgi:membrane protease subunit HflC